RRRQRLRPLGGSPGHGAGAAQHPAAGPADGGARGHRQRAGPGDDGVGGRAADAMGDGSGELSGKPVAGTGGRDEEGGQGPASCRKVEGVRVKPIRVVIVDDHEVVRLGLKTLLNRVSDLEVVGEAGSATEAEEGVAATQPDVVIMDIRMPGGSGIEACRVIRSRWPEVKVIMLTSYSDDEAVIGSVMAGASGYVLKQIGTQELVNAIRRVYNGESLLDPTVTGKILERVRSGVTGEG